MTNRTEPSRMGPACTSAVGRITSSGDASQTLRIRRLSGLLLAPLAFCLVLAVPFPALPPSAHRLAAVMAAVILLWITEALPLPVTALGAAAACVVLRVAPARQVFSSFADPLIFLFIGSFILARAIFIHGLDRRLAFGVLSLPWIGARSGRMLVAFGAVTAFLSVWVANAAVTAMMFAIAMSIIAFLTEPGGDGAPLISARFATGLLLMTTLAASVGGLATPVGAAPNLIGIGFIRNVLRVDFSFAQWCVVGAPAALMLFLFLAVYLRIASRAGAAEIPHCRQLLLAEKSKLGPWTVGQRSTLIACGATVALWLAPALLATVRVTEPVVYESFRQSCPEPVAALLGAILLFLLPGDRGERAIDWREASRIDWGVILLFGGGLSLGMLSFQTGLAAEVGHGLAAAFPTQSSLGLLILATVTAALVSEVTSNTASANMVIPVVIVIAQAAGADPLEPALGATLGSGLGFMLPVSTPCNAIVYSSGRVPLRHMMIHGLMLDIVGAAVIIGAVRLLAPLARGV